MYPAVTDRDVLDMPFVEPPPDTQAKIVAEMRLGLQLMEEARGRMSKAVSLMDEFLDSGVEGYLPPRQGNDSAPAAGEGFALSEPKGVYSRTRPGGGPRVHSGHRRRTGPEGAKRRVKK
jgi:hypothetical protein